MFVSLWRTPRLYHVQWWPDLPLASCGPFKTFVRRFRSSRRGTYQRLTSPCLKRAAAYGFIGACGASGPIHFEYLALGLAHVRCRGFPRPPGPFMKGGVWATGIVSFPGPLPLKRPFSPFSRHQIVSVLCFIPPDGVHHGQYLPLGVEPCVGLVFRPAQ